MAALSHPVGTKVRVTKGSHKNRTGVIKIQDGHKVIVLDNDGSVLFGASDSMVQEA